MSESDRSFYIRRLQEELRQALMSDTPQLEDLHLGWAMLYRNRLQGGYGEAVSEIGEAASRMRLG